MSRYDYTPDGKLVTRTWARGVVTTYSYDDNGSLTNTVYSDGTPTISLAYSRAGRQVRAEDAAGITTFLYDDFGAVTNETVRLDVRLVQGFRGVSPHALRFAFRAPVDIMRGIGYNIGMN